MKNRYPNADLMKFLFSFLIIAIHTRPFIDISPFMDYFFSDALSRIAVPFFFAASGYFLFKKKAIFSHKKSSFFIFCKKTLIIYLSASLFYFIIRMLLTGERALSTPANYLKDVLFYEPYYHLWYFHATLFAALVIFLLSERFTMKKIFLFSLFFYFMGLLSDSYFGLIPSGFLYDVRQSYLELFMTARNGLFFGLPFMSLGAWMASESILTQGKHVFRWLMLFVPILFLEAYMVLLFGLTKGGNMYVSLMPITYLLIQIALSPREHSSTFPVKARKMSTIIFLVHPFFIFMLQNFFFIESNLTLFFSVAVLSLLVSFFYVEINN